ncbi:hypothetical protein C8R48DRAFT_712713 [Suillus tomentosus]|nr:hypothetical protein C8R48DRAFT_712713 [Suillus tomentosus]
MLPLSPQVQGHHLLRQPPRTRRLAPKLHHHHRYCPLHLFTLTLSLQARGCRRLSQPPRAR